MILTSQQMLNVAIVSLILLPCLFVALGIVSWWRRRDRPVSPRPEPRFRLDS